MELKYSVYTVKEDIGILFTFQWNCYSYTIKTCFTVVHCKAVLPRLWEVWLPVAKRTCF